MFRKIVLTVSLVLLIALVSSALVQSSRKAGDVDLGGNHVTNDTGNMPRLKPVPTNTTGAQKHNHDPNPAREASTGGAAGTNAGLFQLLPLDHTAPTAGQPVDFSWSDVETAVRYRLEVEAAYGKVIFSTELMRGVRACRVPSWRLDGQDGVRWRVIALDQEGAPIAETTWRILLPLSSECEN